MVKKTAVEKAPKRAVEVETRQMIVDIQIQETRNENRGNTKTTRNR